MFKLEIATDNDAFQPHPEAQIAWILSQLASYLDIGVFSSGWTLRDSNGNAVGHAWLEPNK